MTRKLPVSTTKAAQTSKVLPLGDHTTVLPSATSSEPPMVTRIARKLASEEASVTADWVLPLHSSLT